MATSSLYTLLLLSLATTSLFLPSNGNPAEDVCKQTTNPPLCEKALSASKFGDEPLPIQAKIALQTGGYESVVCRRKFESLSNSTTDPELKKLYEQCQKLYNDSGTTIGDAETDVKEKRWGEVQAKAGKVGGFVDECEKAFKDGSSPVHEESKEVAIVSEVLVVIAKALLS